MSKLDIGTLLLNMTAGDMIFFDGGSHWKKPIDDPEEPFGVWDNGECFVQNGQTLLVKNVYPCIPNERSDQYKVSSSC